MFTLIDAVLQVSVTTAILYGLLGAASLSVRLSSRGTWRRQVDGWWRILPIVTVALLTCPVGLVLLAGFIYFLAVAELAPQYPGARASSGATPRASWLARWLCIGMCRRPRWSSCSSCCYRTSALTH